MPDGRSLEFRGRADRVDRTDDGRLLVSDYKTGKGAGYRGIDVGDPVRGGTMLQLGLYAEAAHQLLGASSTEAHYWMVDPRAGYERRGYPWTPDRRQRFIDVLATIVDGIEAGVFLVDPGDWNIWRGTYENCMYCNFDRLCVRNRGEQADVKVAAPGVAQARSTHVGRRVMSVPADQATRDLVRPRRPGPDAVRRGGAGTGKTTELVARIANLVLVEGVRLANIAAITFTEAAAAELQARIRVKFEKRAAETTDPSERERCAQALADVDLAALSTLHGFASRLLNEFAIAAGLPPRVRVLDEVSSQLAHEDRWERFVDGLYGDTANDEVLLRAALVGIDFEPQYQGHATLKDVAVELNGNWDRLTGVAQDPLPPLHEPDFGPFDRAVAAVCRAFPASARTRTDKFHAHLVERLIPEMTAIVDIADPYRKLARLAAPRATRGPAGAAARRRRGTVTPKRPRMWSPPSTRRSKR